MTRDEWAMALAVGFAALAASLIGTAAMAATAVHGFPA